MSLRDEVTSEPLRVGMGIWAGAALAVLLGCLQLYEWLSCRRSPSRRNGTARSSFVAAFVGTVAGRRGLFDASIVSAGGLFMLGVGAPLSLVGSDSPWRSVARFLTLGCLLLFGFGQNKSVGSGRGSVGRRQRHPELHDQRHVGAASAKADDPQPLGQVAVELLEQRLVRV